MPGEAVLFFDLQNNLMFGTVASCSVNPIYPTPAGFQPPRGLVRMLSK